MKNLRKYGNAPFDIAVIHGGPGKQIMCPVVAIHEDYDPHPAEGVKDPLSRILKNCRLVTLKNCGHDPWIEPYAKDKFYEVLKEELG